MGIFKKSTMKVLIVLVTFFAATLACRDIYNQCSKYNKAKYCSHSWLKKYCQKYCGHCTPATQAPPTQSVCSDRYSRCSNYNKQAYCKHPWLKQNCRKYCGYCDGAQTQPPNTSTTNTSTTNTSTSNSSTWNTSSWIMWTPTSRSIACCWGENSKCTFLAMADWWLLVLFSILDGLLLLHIAFIVDQQVN